MIYRHAGSGCSIPGRACVTENVDLERFGISVRTQAVQSAVQSGQMEPKILEIGIDHPS